MKKLVSILLLISTMASAQIPQGISHRGTVYTSAGVLVPNATNVAIKISILDNTSLVYSETFSDVHTNSQGQYSLNIGKGTQIHPFNSSDFFKSINWGGITAYLKVEIDPNGGTNYSVSGSNQLMSVPYALYSINSNPSSSIVTVKSISDLKLYTNFDPTKENATVYVQGYYSPSDGGGGTFIFKRYADMGLTTGGAPSYDGDLRKPKNDDGIFIDSFHEGFIPQGIWIRQFSEVIDARYYGVRPVSIPELSGATINDWSSKIQAAIDYASKNVPDINSRPYGYNNTNVVFFPPGGYDISHIVIKSGVTLLGSSTQNTIIKSIGDNEPYLITMDTGVVKDVNISNIAFVGNSKDQGENVWPTYMNKGCFSFKGVSSGVDSFGNATAGGLWHSTFKNISIIRFTGTSINFEGGGAGSNYLLPNQFITMEGVEVESVGELSMVPGHSNFKNTSHALNIVGQNGQFSITNCRFDGGEYLDPFPSTGQSAKYTPSGYNININSTSDQSSPQMINFNTCTIQSGETGILIKSTICINIYGCWFENFERAIIVKGENTSPISSSKSINIANCKFQFSAGELGSLPANSGRVILVENSQVNVENNYIIDPVLNEHNYFISVDNIANTNETPVLGITSSGNYFEVTNPNVSISETSGIMQKLQISNLTYPGGGTNTVSGINMWSKSLAFIQNSGSIYRINSMQNAGEIIFIRSNSSGDIIFFSDSQGESGKNINLSGKSSLTLKFGEAATFVKVDNVDGNGKSIYQLISVSNNEDSNWNNVNSFSWHFKL